MKNLSELLNREDKLTDEVHAQKNKVQKLKQELDMVTNQIADIQELHDYSSFKFVSSNREDILKSIASKHKIPKSQELKLEGPDKTPMSLSVPWATEKCSDENPCNPDICPRCTLLHFFYVMDKLLAEYYVK